MDISLYLMNTKNKSNPQTLMQKETRKAQIKRKEKAGFEPTLLMSPPAL